MRACGGTFGKDQRFSSALSRKNETGDHMCVSAFPWLANSLGYSSSRVCRWDSAASEKQALLVTAPDIIGSVSPWETSCQ